MPDILPLRAVPLSPAPSRPEPSPLVADARGLSKLLTVGLRTVRTWDAAGKLPTPVRIGGRVVWPLDEIRDWLAAGAPDRETWTAARAAKKK